MKRTLCFVFLTFLSINLALACTNIAVKAEDGSVVVGRTLEFGPPLNSNVISSPQGREFTSTTPDGKAGKSWKSKYGYVFMDFFGVHQTIDGMNEKGLSFGYLYMPGFAEYQVVPPGKENQSMDYLSFGDWILGNFDNVDDIKAAVKDIYVYATPINAGVYKNMIFPLHAVIVDQSGKSITIEFVKGKIHVYDNQGGILTNSPTYPWHIINLNNYINLTPYAPKTIKVGPISYFGTGQGSGSIGTPGDYSPPSRFVKISLLAHSAYPVPHSLAALNLTQHILNNVDIPNGAVRGEKGTNDPSDKTQWTVFKDLKNKVLYFNSYTNSTLKKIDLSKIDFSQGATQLSYPVASKQIVVDVTKQYQQTKLK